MDEDVTGMNDMLPSDYLMLLFSHNDKQIFYLVLSEKACIFKISEKAINIF